MHSPAARWAGGHAPLVSDSLSEEHRDPYRDALGPGVPVYNGWVIEEDDTSCTFGASSTTDFGVTKDDGSSGGVSKSKLESGRSEKHHQVQWTFRTPSGRPSTNELWRFRTRGCQDCWAAVLFVTLVACVLLWGMTQVRQLQLTERDLAVIAGGAEWAGKAATPIEMASMGGSNPDKVLHGVTALRAGVMALWARGESFSAGEGGDSGGASSSPSHPATVGFAMRILMWCAAAGITTVLVAYGGLLLMAVCPRELIIIEAAVSSLFFIISASLAFAQGAPLMAMLFAFLTFTPLLWVYLIGDRIPFTTTMLCTTVSILRRHRSLFAVSLGSVVAGWCFVVTAAVCVLPSVLRLLAGTATGGDGVYPTVVVLCIFWVQEVLSTLVHVTVCGVVATWYFAGEVKMPPSPVGSSFRRAVTTSFGSVCLGSLITAIVSFVRFLIESARMRDDGDSFWLCVMDCLVGCINDLVRYFNQYAFVHVAVYGCSYIDAATGTWALVKQCAFSAIFNDSLTGQVIGVLTFMSALIMTLLTVSVTQNAAVMALMAVMSLIVSAIIYGPVGSCVMTIFVCFAEVPSGLQLSSPDLYDALVSADAGYTQRREGGNLYGTALV
ncbi:hypothetical protein JKF63_06684 [Porcisia hertigi]|uniref:Choline transporter-like protein n=1 Tax=Porcisia hertigi TaxID=2761500 RepID=A0A836LES9_9TRYP|nr:hypothetical protein JKF63_06684 [Porcisia hertigi]